MTADDHELVERTRKINKTLSMFVFALQEDAELSIDNQLEIAKLLEALAEAIRDRAARHGDEISSAPVVIEGDGVQPRALEPSREVDRDNGP